MPPNEKKTRKDDKPIISVRGLTNRFGEQVVHEGLDLDVMRGEIIGVVGGSGTGKSVLMRSILALRVPDEGEIEVLGVDARSEDPADRNHIERRTGVLFQDGALFSSLTVGENVQVPLKEHHPDLSDSLRYELALLKTKLAGLPADALNKLPSQLSGGMRKRAGLARALALDPPLLFLDEPTAGLDPIGAAAFDELTLTLQRALGLTVFLITHDLDTLYAICDRVAVLADKKVLITAPIEEVEKFDHPWVQEYFHGPRARAAQKTTGTRDEKERPRDVPDKAADEALDENRHGSLKQDETTATPPTKAPPTKAPPAKAPSVKAPPAKGTD
ncbi:MAG: ABC transporter ATP-binding protein [Pseudomonadota bacterium]|nr:ABC transporter ATP-binding protein [Pseudomonadota bacterium]